MGQRRRRVLAARKQSRVMQDTTILTEDSKARLASPTVGEIALTLADIAARTTDPHELVREVGRLLCRTPLRLERIFVSVQALHPAFRARTYLWHLPEDHVRMIEWPHGLAKRPGYLASPDHHVHATGTELRVRDLRRLGSSPCDLYGKLRDQGYTDYLIVPLRFSDGMVNTLSIATRVPDGFPEKELKWFRQLLSLLSIVFERTTVIESFESTLHTYLGRHVSAQIMRGRIRPSHGEHIEASILFADLNDFTAIAARLGPAETVRLLNDYFDCLVDPIEDSGGYVLKFIGDAVLAFFPAGPNDRPDPLAAIEKIRQRLSTANIARAAGGEPPLHHGVCLHFGTVLYGNIGSRRRLDFTIIGDAVNVCARCVADTRRLGADYICTDAFARRFGEKGVTRIGECRVQGIAAPVVLYST
jgi:adenylate cyclase